MDPRQAYLIGSNAGYNKYAAGGKRYGAAGRDTPNLGPTSSPEGYAERDLKMKAQRNAMLARMKAQQGGAFASSANLNPLGRSF